MLAVAVVLVLVLVLVLVMGVNVIPEGERRLEGVTQINHVTLQNNSDTSATVAVLWWSSARFGAVW
ncbi:hypothetical protein C500_06816 [Natrialba magadii ATCC 43099]|uniref:Uncharacterized protein n=1 Tax=Natrialba magadii (strain ATCC 43099 / DSM 3394 / CCM 3739 / CIP 104546 / IAM 13178 / JCM 8861 / NBRC 102185 / NCIMB 2190 / MS3) TaxID=547559 RepID=L9V4J9_NATMM|nr:hypothetical protein C500_06816 [Natrialba magadii ATCC 43099]